MFYLVTIDLVTETKMYRQKSALCTGLAAATQMTFKSIMRGLVMLDGCIISRLYAGKL